MNKQFGQITKDFTPKNVHQELKERMDNFSEIEHVNRLNFYYLPMMRDHAMKIDRQIKEFAEVKEVVRHFDQTLCLKASKSDFNQMKKENLDLFLSIDSW